MSTSPKPRYDDATIREMRDHYPGLDPDQEPCAICGCELLETRAHAADGTPVCDTCADYIANTLVYACSGQYLTWPNEPRPSRYAKKAKIGKRLRTAVFERDAYRCRHCGAHTDLHLDHVVPESKGGPSTIDNLQTLCGPCNRRKGVS